MSYTGLSARQGKIPCVAGRSTSDRILEHHAVSGMTVTEPVDLSGFNGWLTFAELASATVPRGAGVYVIVRPTDLTPEFRADAPYRGDAPFPVADVEARWVHGERLVYIGMATLGKRRDGLHRRLRQFRKYGAGGAPRHSGGRRIFQLADHADLLVAWRVTDDAEARHTERAMIAAFQAHHGVRPFANDAGGRPVISGYHKV